VRWKVRPPGGYTAVFHPETMKIRVFERAAPPGLQGVMRDTIPGFRFAPSWAIFLRSLREPNHPYLRWDGGPMRLFSGQIVRRFNTPRTKTRSRGPRALFRVTDLVEVYGEWCFQGKSSSLSGSSGPARQRSWSPTLSAEKSGKDGARSSVVNRLLWIGGICLGESNAISTGACGSVLVP
jgi:hypothetical protein